MPSFIVPIPQKNITALGLLGMAFFISLMEYRTFSRFQNTILFQSEMTVEELETEDEGIRPIENECGSSL
ncbi:hypothetical protein AGMMS49949_08850 [Alphaproteobacteria bacterium]|nr:hypothetical protein AGMMS49949_08820 [Alphaproteobacteria bacterium]GHS94834.1 hypothetical protein AGMMS49949_08850 [Alphaproteobacteria bacterium]